jgi:hypothetical protein
VIEKIYKAVPVVLIDSLARKELSAPLRDHVSVPILQTMTSRGFEALEAGTLDARDDSHLVCVPASLDAQGWKEVAKIIDEALAMIAHTRAESTRRLSDTDRRGIHSTLIVAHFESPQL